MVEQAKETRVDELFKLRSMSLVDDEELLQGINKIRKDWGFEPLVAIPAQTIRMIDMTLRGLDELEKLIKEGV